MGQAQAKTFYYYGYSVSSLTAIKALTLRAASASPSE
jgi:hypothetical protein